MIYSKQRKLNIKAVYLVVTLLSSGICHASDQENYGSFSEILNKFSKNPKDEPSHKDNKKQKPLRSSIEETQRACTFIVELPALIKAMKNLEDETQDLINMTEGKINNLVYCSPRTTLYWHSGDEKEKAEITKNILTGYLANIFPELKAHLENERKKKATESKNFSSITSPSSIAPRINMEDFIKVENKNKNTTLPWVNQGQDKPDKESSEGRKTLNLLREWAYYLLIENGYDVVTVHDLYLPCLEKWWAHLPGELNIRKDIFQILFNEEDSAHSVNFSKNRQILKELESLLVRSLVYKAQSLHNQLLPLYLDLKVSASSLNNLEDELRWENERLIDILNNSQNFSNIENNIRDELCKAILKVRPGISYNIENEAIKDVFDMEIRKIILINMCRVKEILLRVLPDQLKKSNPPLSAPKPDPSKIYADINAIIKAIDASRTQPKCDSGSPWWGAKTTSNPVPLNYPPVEIYIPTLLLEPFNIDFSRSKRGKKYDKKRYLQVMPVVFPEEKDSFKNIFIESKIQYTLSTHFPSFKSREEFPARKYHLKKAIKDFKFRSPIKKEASRETIFQNIYCQLNRLEDYCLTLGIKGKEAFSKIEEMINYYLTVIKEMQVDIASNKPEEGIFSSCLTEFLNNNTLKNLREGKIEEKKLELYINKYQRNIKLAYLLAKNSEKGILNLYLCQYYKNKYLLGQNKNEFIKYFSVFPSLFFLTKNWTSVNYIDISKREINENCKLDSFEEELKNAVFLLVHKGCAKDSFSSTRIDIIRLIKTAENYLLFQEKCKALSLGQELAVGIEEKKLFEEYCNNDLSAKTALENMKKQQSSLQEITLPNEPFTKDCEILIAFFDTLFEYTLKKSLEYFNLNHEQLDNLCREVALKQLNNSGELTNCKSEIVLHVPTHIKLSEPLEDYHPPLPSSNNNEDKSAPISPELPSSIITLETDSKPLEDYHPPLPSSNNNEDKSAPISPELPSSIITLETDSKPLEDYHPPLPSSNNNEDKSAPTSPEPLSSIIILETGILETDSKWELLDDIPLIEDLPKDGTFQSTNQDEANLSVGIAPLATDVALQLQQELSK